MKRIFYYSGYRLSVFHWHNNECIDSFAFNPDNDGIEKFRLYLQSSPAVSARLLIDLIEEDFHKITIPHVNYKDRKSIVKRTIDRAYREDHRFINYKVIDREKTGRKDDIVLYSVLSHSSMLDPWLDVIYETSTSLSGIWSVPLITNELYKHIDSTHNNILIVSQQVPSNLRQTFIKNGNFESSRLAVVNLDDDSIGNYIENETLQTIRFLSNNRNIGFDEVIEIHIICNENDIDEIRSHCQDTPRRTYKYHIIRDLHKNLGIRSSESREHYCNVLFTYLCSKVLLPVGHYSDSNTLHHFFHKLTSIGLSAAGIIILLTSLIFAFSLHYDSTILKTEATILADQQRALSNQHIKQLEGYKDQIKLAKIAESTVALSGKIKNISNITPHAFLSTVSKSLARTNLKSIKITRFSWDKLNKEDTNSNKKIANPSRYDYTKDSIVLQKVILGGHFIDQQQSVQSIVSQTTSLVNNLRNIPGTISATLLRAPLDINPASKLSNQHGFIINTASNNLDRNKFEIELIIESPLK